MTIPATGSHRGALLLVAFSLVFLEMLWSWRKRKNVYHTRETLANIGIFAGFQLAKLLMAGYFLAVLNVAYAHRAFTLPSTGWTFGLAFVLVDFSYYWLHYSSHKIRFLWAFHLVHHSSPWMNLTTAYRLNWLSGLITPFFTAPLAWLGVPLPFILGAYGLNLAYQFFCHTEAVGKLGLVDKVLDTPSNHRVHHASNPAYIDKNFGGVFMVWDHLFGTYAPELDGEKLRYGITTGFVSHNPFVLVFHGFRDWARGRMGYKG